jgi:hypothetical protein
VPVSFTLVEVRVLSAASRLFWQTVTETPEQAAQDEGLDEIAEASVC